MHAEKARPSSRVVFEKAFQRRVKPSLHQAGLAMQVGKESLSIFPSPRRPATLESKGGSRMWSRRQFLSRGTVSLLSLAGAQLSESRAADNLGRDTLPD